MGAEEPMMRARQRGGSCPIPGHGALCEPSSERSHRDRVDDRLEVRRAVSGELEPQECPKCGWYDYHPHSLLGRICVWCREEWS